MRVTALASHFEMSLNAVSKHIKTLEAAGLVARRREWREHLIELKIGPLNEIEDWFKDLRSIWEIRLENLETLLLGKTDMTDQATELKLNVSRTISASPDTLFDAWLDPKMLARFMTPGPNMTVPEATSDARVGGRFKVVMRAGDQDLPHEGTYKEIDRPNRLVFTWESPFLERDDSTVTLIFTPDGDSTRIDLEHIRLPTEESVANHTGGWTSILQALAGTV